MTGNEESSFKERTIESLLKHGFPLEIKTHQSLELEGWKSRAESAFEDPDEKITRRIDFVAWKRKKVNSKFFENAMITIFVECKKRENAAWVFYRTDKKSADPDDIEAVIHRAPSILILENEEWLNAFEVKELVKVILNSHQVSTEHPFIAIAGHDIAVETEREREQRMKKEEKGSRGKKQSDNRGDFLNRASIVITKALEAEIETELQHWKKNLDHDSGFPPDFEIFYPVVVFQGKMYEAKSIGDNLHLDKVQYVQLVWESRKKKHIIDVVSSDYFPIYLQILEEELVRLSEIIDSLKDLWDKIRAGLGGLLFGQK